METLTQDDNVVETSSAEVTPEPTSTTTSTETVNEAPQVDNTRPVTSLSEAKEVLKSQKESKTVQKPAADVKPNESLDYKKQYEEIQKAIGKQSRELGELRKFHKENQAFIESQRKLQQEQQENSQLQKLMQENPAEAIAQIARREQMAAVAPIQEQMIGMQAVNVNNNILQALGENYGTYSPVMVEILEEFERMDEFNASNPDPSQRTNWAQKLAADPQSLMKMAQEKLNKNNASQQATISQQKKADNLKIASGIAKNTNVKATVPESFANMTLDQMTQELKRLGIKK